MAALRRFSRATHVVLALIALSSFAIPAAQAQLPSGYSGPGRYKIENLASGKVLDVDLRDGRTVRQWDAAFGSDQLNPPNNVRNQQWDIEEAGSGFVRIRSAQTGMTLDVQQPTTREAAPVILARPGNDQTQLWRIEDAGQGRVKITSRIGKSLDLPDGSHSNGKLFQVFPPNGGDNQKFLLFRIDRGRDFVSDHRQDPDFRSRDNDFRGWGDTYMIYCASDDMERVWCPADSRFGVRIIRQRSEAGCMEGQTWGYGKRGIWVDRGCRADFRVSGDWQARAAAIVYCPSDDMRRNVCSVNTLDGVFIVRQRSEADCVFNHTWGYDRDFIWVDRGCRADFEIVDRREREWLEWSRDWDDDDRRGWERDHRRYRDRDDRDRDWDGRPRDDRPPYLN